MAAVLKIIEQSFQTVPILRADCSSVALSPPVVALKADPGDRSDGIADKFAFILANWEEL